MASPQYFAGCIFLEDAMQNKVRHFKRHVPVRAAIPLCWACIAACALPSAQAQDVSASLQRVEVTGSAIKRVAGETALPVQTYTRKAIEQTGATNTTDLIQRLPAMQSATVEGSAVGGMTYGFAGVSIHGIGENRSLVLLNGHRIAKSGGQAVTGAFNAVDLNTLPISAIERIEVLTDGASALYGADAVAGVLNIITRKSATGFVLSAGLSNPTAGGAEEQRFSLSKGVGNYEQDGFNFSFSASGDKRAALYATDRDFARTGIISGMDESGRVIGISPALGTSKRSTPANVNFYGLGGGAAVASVSPSVDASGNCPPEHIRSALTCRYDYTSALEIYPERERLNGYFSFDKDLGGGTKWFNEWLLGHTRSIARIAPPPGELAVTPGTVAWNHAMAIAAHQGLVAGVNFDPNTIDANLRFTELGPRTHINEQNLTHLVTGLEGTLQNWDISAALVHSENEAKATFGGGYATVSGVASAIKLGFDPFLPLGTQSAAGNAALQAAKLDGYWNGGLSTLDALSAQASRAIGALDGGPVQWAVGATAQNEKLDAKTGDMLGGRRTYAVDSNGQPCATSGKPCTGTGIDQRFGETGIQPAYSASRQTLGLFAELGLPVSKQVELTTSARFDNSNDFGSDFTGKLALRYQPTRQLLLRGSVGTGYIAPSLAQVNAPQQNYGVTRSAYKCSGTAATVALQTLANTLGVLCDAGAQFNKYAKGNIDLKPETSRQATLGLVWDLTPSASLSADLWTVQISNAIGQVSEQVVFSDPAKYSRYFTPFTDPSTGKKLLAFVSPNDNLGEQVTTGLDLEVSTRMKLGDGRWTSNFLTTFVLRSDAQAQKDGVYFSSLGNRDQQGTVVFDWQGKWINTYAMDKWSHTLTANFKSSYLDSAADPSILSSPTPGAHDPNYRITVPSFVTFDWQTTYQPNKMVTLSAGVLNLFNKPPPFLLSQGGSSRGQEIGWDGRYFDPRGSTVYVNGSLNF
jgi:iron complex outermembrane receptor protein